MAIITYREALNQAIHEEMERDPDVFLMGEEVGQYQGAYKVSQGLIDTFTDKRIIDTPIAELGFAGLGVGAAMTGLRPIIEFMTFNFSLVAIDQIINSAAKMYQMSAGQYNIPIVFRGPGGPAVQVAAQHSQALESFYAHVPGLKVVMPSTPKDAKFLLKAAIRDENPVIFIEGETLYNDSGEVSNTDDIIPLGVGDIKRGGDAVTIVSWSHALKTCMQAADILEKNDNIHVEIIDPRTLRPLDESLIISSVKKTGRLVTVEETWPICSVGSYIASRIHAACFDYMDAPTECVTMDDVSMPYARNLELEVLPSVEDVIVAVKKVLYL